MLGFSPRTGSCSTQLSNEALLFTEHLPEQEPCGGWASSTGMEKGPCSAGDAGTGGSSPTLPSHHHQEEERQRKGRRGGFPDAEPTRHERPAGWL